MIDHLKPRSDTFLSHQREENISRGILAIRGHRVILDSDLAALYRVTTKALNQAVKRNAGRFPEDFAFRGSNEMERTRRYHECAPPRLKFSPSCHSLTRNTGPLWRLPSSIPKGPSKPVFSSFALSSGCAKLWRPTGSFRNA
ncbi:MAG: ORF6N domain-containing protein [Deltaproteobacteria bacterium]|nr:ORF6N domain-containing protein [Candidatus Deferrimicrobium borealis]